MNESNRRQALRRLRTIERSCDYLREIIEAEARPGRLSDGGYDVNYWRDRLDDVPKLPKRHTFRPSLRAWELYPALSRICGTVPVSITYTHDIERAAVYFRPLAPSLHAYAASADRRIVLHYSPTRRDIADTATDTGLVMRERLGRFVEAFRWQKDHPASATVVIDQEIVNENADGYSAVAGLTEGLDKVCREMLGERTHVQFYAHLSRRLASNDDGEDWANLTVWETPGPNAAVLYLPHEIRLCRDWLRDAEITARNRQQERYAAWLSLGASYRRSKGHPWGAWTWHQVPDTATASYWGWLLNVIEASDGFASRYGPVHRAGGVTLESPLIVLYPSPGDPRGTTLEEFEAYARAATSA